MKNIILNIKNPRQDLSSPQGFDGPVVWSWYSKSAML